MKKFSIIILSLVASLQVIGQKDPEAIRILSEFSKKATSAPSVSIDFDITANDTREDDITTFEGSALIKGDSYRLTLPDYYIWADGKAIYNYLPDVKEVTITEPDPGAESFITNPSLLFTLYNEGYKVRLLDETSKDWTIDLYPEDISANLIRIRLRIGKALYDLLSAEYKTKDGMIITLKTTKYDLTFKPREDDFTFNPASYKGVEIVDMR